jgi:DNA-binding MarR family transcriptional regulator
MTGPEVCPWVIGPDGLAHLTEVQAAAWSGLMRVHRRITRELEGALQARHGLSLSALEALGRLAAAPDRRLRIARLAERIELSLSRTSRLLDALEARGLVEHQPCPEDSRASNVQLTAAGARTIERAMSAFHSWLEEVLADWSGPEREQLVRLLDRFTRDLNATVECHGD